MKYFILALALFTLSACSSVSLDQPVLPQGADTPSDPVQELPEVKLADLGPAPELTNKVWLNVDQPLRLADLRGQVVLLEMWTFG